MNSKKWHFFSCIFRLQSGNVLCLLGTFSFFSTVELIVIFDVILQFNERIITMNFDDGKIICYQPVFMEFMSITKYLICDLAAQNICALIGDLHKADYRLIDLSFVSLSNFYRNLSKLNRWRAKKNKAWLRMNETVSHSIFRIDDVY